MTASAFPQLSPTAWPDAQGPAPVYIGFPSRANFPAGLLWSGRGEVPAVGQRVRIYLNGIGEATVEVYFHYEGYLGVLVAPDELPAHLTGTGVRMAHAYGIDLEPRRPQPCFQKAAPGLTEISPDWIPEYPETAEVA
jgi:hypothetical protein